MHKPVKAAVPTPQQPAPQLQLQPEALLPPDQVPTPAPPAPQVPPAPTPPVHIPDPVQPQNPPAHIPDPILPPTPPVHIPNPNPVQPQLNCSYFKSEFSAKQEDVEAHLLRTNDWMETQNFPQVAKVQSICLTLTEKPDCGMKH